MTTIKLIMDDAALIQYVEQIKNAKWIGIDTEFMRVKTYFPILCLIQICTEDVRFCVDTIAVKDLSPLQAVLSNTDVTKIFHSCRQDLEALDLVLDQPLGNLFDTQIAAAFCGLGDQVSYASLVESMLGVTLDKSHTRTDWAARPLSAMQMQYAIKDVLYLKPIEQELNQQLDKLGRLQWHAEECERILKLADYRIDPNEGWKRLKGGWKVPQEFQQYAKSLANWRENKAQIRNRPREWILSTAALLDISVQLPKSVSAMSEINGMNPWTIRNSGQEIFKVLQNTPISSADQPVWSRRVPLDSAQRKVAKKIMVKLKVIAEQAQISQSLLANRNDVESMLHGDMNILLLSGWRNKVAGKEIRAEFFPQS